MCVSKVPMGHKISVYNLNVSIKSTASYINLMIRRESLWTNSKSFL